MLAAMLCIPSLYQGLPCKKSKETSNNIMYVAKVNLAWLAERFQEKTRRGRAVARRAVQPVRRAAHRQACQPDETIQAPRCPLLHRVSKGRNGIGLTGTGGIPRRVRGTGGGGFWKRVCFTC